jgi:Ca2+-binding EF-hand superfamily protein
MGAALSVSEPNRLAVAAISHVVHLGRGDVLRLEEELYKKSTRALDGSVAVTHAAYAESIAQCRIHPADKEILDRLFVLFDRAGDGIVNVKEMLVGVSLLVKAAPKEKLKLALELFDHDRTGRLTKEDLLLALQWLCKVCSWFGDKPPTADALQGLTDRVFVKIGSEEEPTDTTYCVYIEPILTHPLLEDFISQAEDCPRLQSNPLD